PWVGAPPGCVVSRWATFARRIVARMTFVHRSAMRVLSTFAMRTMRPFRTDRPVLTMRPAWSLSFGFGLLPLRPAVVPRSSRFLDRLSGAVVPMIFGNMRRMEWMLGIHRDLLVDGLFDVPEERTLFRIAERDRDAVIAGTGRAADPMHVALRLIRQIE